MPSSRVADSPSPDCKTHLMSGISGSGESAVFLTLASVVLKRTACWHYLAQQDTLSLRSQQRNCHDSIRSTFGDESSQSRTEEKVLERMPTASRSPSPTPDRHPQSRQIPPRPGTRSREREKPLAVTEWEEESKALLYPTTNNRGRRPSQAHTERVGLV